MQCRTVMATTLARHTFVKLKVDMLSQSLLLFASKALEFSVNVRFSIDISDDCNVVSVECSLLPPARQSQRARMEEAIKVAFLTCPEGFMFSSATSVGLFCALLIAPENTGYGNSGSSSLALASGCCWVL